MRHTRPETLAEYLLRLRPETEADMEAALTDRAIGMAEAAALQREVRALEEKRADLARHRAHPRNIDRLSRDLILLRRARAQLEVDP